MKYKVMTPLVMPATTLVPFTLYESVDYTFLPISECKVYNYKTGIATDILPYMDFLFGQDGYYTYMYHPGTSTISTLQRGKHYIYIKSGYNSEYWSDLFMVSSEKTILFEFHNTKSFGKLWMRNENYKAYYRGYTFDEGEFEEYSDSITDKDNYDVYTYQRQDKTRTVMVMGDSNAIDCLNLMKMCDTVYITDEVSKRQEVVITGVKPEPKGANYMNVVVKYRVVDNSIISVNTNAIIKAAFEQKGVAFKAKETGIYLGPDKIYLGPDKIVL